MIYEFAIHIDLGRRFPTSFPSSHKRSSGFSSISRVQLLFASPSLIPSRSFSHLLSSFRSSRILIRYLWSIPQLSESLYINMHFLQIATALAAVASAATIPTKKRAADASGKLEFFGVNESGAEFGTAIPGVYGTVSVYSCI